MTDLQYHEAVEGWQWAVVMIDEDDETHYRVVQRHKLRNAPSHWTVVTRCNDRSESIKEAARLIFVTQGAMMGSGQTPDVPMHLDS
jgi:hypothetical protein